MTALSMLPLPGAPAAPGPRRAGDGARALSALPRVPGAPGLAARAPRWADLAQALRTLGVPWLQAQEQPHAELLALVWGPHFDREHARQLLAQTAAPGLSDEALEQAARCFDALQPQRQQRLRRWLLRQHQRWDNASDTLH
ncbi:MAG: hypothetical protein ACT4NV_20255 [Rhodoferax sp.]